MALNKKKFSRELKKQSNADLAQFSKVEEVFTLGSETVCDKIDAFPKYASRQAIAKFLTKYEIFKKILHVNGSIIECGGLHGGGLMAWAKLSSILEPANHTRKIVGFDTFEGDELKKVIELYDLNRPLSHIPKVELVKGNIIETAPEFLKKNPHLIVSLLYLDLDVYEPTKAAIETFLSRMVKGSIIVFDELNADVYPGETLAVEETIGLKNLKIQRFEFDSYVSYAIIE